MKKHSPLEWLLENIECKNKWLNDVTRFLDFYKLDGLQCGGK